jgi:hypothetical protein
MSMVGFTVMVNVRLGPTHVVVPSVHVGVTVIVVEVGVVVLLFTPLKDGIPLLCPLVAPSPIVVLLFVQL